MKKNLTNKKEKPISNNFVVSKQTELSISGCTAPRGSSCEKLRLQPCELFSELNFKSFAKW